MRKFEIVKKYENENIVLPKRATNKSAGYDLMVCEDTIIKPKEIKLVNTGLKVKMSDDEALFVFPRSSLALKKGLVMSNSVGVIDADYYNNENNEGHIMIPLMNFKDEEVLIKKGERVAQGIFLKYETVADESFLTGNRTGGFGSSGK